MRSLVLVILLVAVNAAAQPREQGTPRFRSSAEVIAIDVTVIDRTGAPVDDLTAADFTVTVEGKPRAIQSAQFLRSDATRKPPSYDESSNTEAASGRLLLIVTDDASLRPGSHAVVEAAGQVLNQLGPGDLVGVARIPDGGGVPFTTDRARVRNELKRVLPPPPLTARTGAVSTSARRSISKGSSACSGRPRSRANASRRPTPRCSASASLISNKRRVRCCSRNRTGRPRPFAPSSG